MGVGSPEDEHMVYLTPVRRSTRKRYRRDTSVVDSPSLVEGYSKHQIKLLSNEALDLDQT